MITQKTLEKYITQAPEIAKEAETIPEVAERVIKALKNRIEQNRRQAKPTAPEGGISIREASRRYGVHNQTISRWVKRGYIPVLLRTRNELYIDNLCLQKLIEIYKNSPGQGKNTIKQKIASS